MAKVSKAVSSRMRRKRILKAAKGYYGARSRCIRRAKEAVVRAGVYAYRGRKEKKRVFRRLWIARINAAARQLGLSYSKLIHLLRTCKISLNRKMLANIAVTDMEAFKEIVESAKRKVFATNATS
jgi:large subunit ribosomal protein L20